MRIWQLLCWEDLLLGKLDPITMTERLAKSEQTPLLVLHLKRLCGRKLGIYFVGYCCIHAYSYLLRALLQQNLSVC